VHTCRYTTSYTSHTADNHRAPQSESGQQQDHHIQTSQGIPGTLHNQAPSHKSCMDLQLPSQPSPQLHLHVYCQMSLLASKPPL
jgi:hypothetical protein